MNADERRMHWQALRNAAPWLALTVLLYASQVFAIVDSEFTMPVTLLQVPFVLAFLVFIYVISLSRLKEQA